MPAPKSSVDYIDEYAGKHPDEVVSKAQSYARGITPYGAEKSRKATAAAAIYLAYMVVGCNDGVTYPELQDDFDVAEITIRQRRKELLENIDHE